MASSTTIGLPENRLEPTPSSAGAYRPLARVGIDGSCYNAIDPGLKVDLQGWGSHHPVFEEVMMRHKPQLVLEIGTWKGASVLHMHSLAKKHGLQTHFVCIDTWLGSNDTLWLRPDLRQHLNLSNGYPNMFRQFVFNVVALNAQDDISPFPITSTAAARVLKKLGLKFDALYIDAGHEEEEVYFDLALFYDLIAEGGAIFGDDYASGWPGVVKAVDRFCSEHGISAWTGGGKFYFKKPVAAGNRHEAELAGIGRPTVSNVGQPATRSYKSPLAPVADQGDVVVTNIRKKEVRFLVTDRSDHIQRHHASGTFYETEELEMIERHFKAGTTFVDVGANVGNHTLFVGLFLKPNRIVCIEPNPVAIRILLANVALNEMEYLVDMTRLGIGLSDRNGVATLETAKGNLGLTKLVASTTDEGVRVSTGDDIIDEEPVDFVKIDVEGMELQVLRGMRRVIGLNRPTMFVEIMDRNSSALDAWLIENNYVIVEEYKRYVAMKNVLLKPLEAHHLSQA